MVDVRLQSSRGPVTRATIVLQYKVTDSLLFQNEVWPPLGEKLTHEMNCTV